VELRAEAARVRRASRWVGAALWTVAAGAMVTAAATVTAWAVEHGMDPRVAWLVDPLLSVALLAALLGEGVLARHGESGGAWPRVLRWGTAGATLTANTWAPIVAQEPAGVVLHALPPLLLVVLAEAAPRLRLRLAALAVRLDVQADHLEEAAAEATSSAAVVDIAPLAQVAPVGPVVPVGDVVDVAPVAEVRPVRSPRPRPSSSAAAGSGAGLDELRAAIAAEELPAEPSVWAIRQALRVGPTRAAELRAQLLGQDDEAGGGSDGGAMPGQTSVLELVRA
jgi:hypothetical protein